MWLRNVSRSRDVKFSEYKTLLISMESLSQTHNGLFEESMHFCNAIGGSRHHGKVRRSTQHGC